MKTFQITWCGNPQEMLRDIVSIPVHTLIALLPDKENSSIQCLRFIDPEGLTIFTHRQMEQFLLEWRQIVEKASVNGRVELLSQVEELALACKDQPHTQIWIESVEYGPDYCA